MKKVVIGIIIGVIIGLVVGFAPLKEVAYTETEPLSYEVMTSIGTRVLNIPPVEGIQFLDPERSRYMRDSVTYAAICPKVTVTVWNTDTTAGQFEVIIKFYRSAGRTDLCEAFRKDMGLDKDTEFTLNRTLKLEPKEKEEAFYSPRIDNFKDEWTWEYEVTPDTKTVTRYKKVPIFEYLLSRF